MSLMSAKPEEEVALDHFNHDDNSRLSTTEDYPTILHLPNEMLAEIFTFLNHHERLDCRLVCSRWMEIISTHPAFRTNRHLHFDHCFLSPYIEPVNLFLKSDRVYEALTVSRVKFSQDLLPTRIEGNGEFAELREYSVLLRSTTGYTTVPSASRILPVPSVQLPVHELWKKLGEHLLELDCTKLESIECLEAILGDGSHLSKLKKLHLNFRLWPYNQVKLTGVEEVFLHSFCSSGKRFEVLETAFPRLQKIFICSVDYFEGVSFTEMKRHACKIKDLGQNFFQYGIRGGVWQSCWENHEENEVNMYDIMVMQELQLEKLDYRVREVEEFEDLSLILTIQESLTDIRLSCNVFPPTLFTRITSLSVGFMHDVTSFEAISHLVNLTRLEISLSDMYDDNELSPCFFGHTQLSCPKLRTLEITTGGDKNCYDCWKSLCSSLNTQLESFSFSNYGYDNIVIYLIFEYFSGLKELILLRQLGNLHRKAKAKHRRGKNLPNKHVWIESQDFLVQWQPMPRLQKATFCRVTQISARGIDHFCNMCPQITYLKLNDQHVREPDTIFETIAEKLRYLEVLKVDFETPGVSARGIQAIRKHCRRLKHLALGRNEMRQIHDVDKQLLFTAIPSLQLLSSIYWDPCPSTRVTYQEARLTTMPEAKTVEKKSQGDDARCHFSLDDENRTILNDAGLI